MAMNLNKIKLSFIVCVLTCSVLWLNTTTAFAQTNEQKRLIKAAFIYNIAKFTRWPDSISSDIRSTPLSLCIAGEDELGLEGLRGKIVKGHPLSIYSVTTEQAPSYCHILYVSTSALKPINYHALIQSAQNQPILTISEIPEFARSGGGFELYQKEGQTRFIINLGVTRRAGLEINPRLLKLAVIIGQE